MKKMQELEKESCLIKERLAPWKGMTFAEARKKGFGKREEELQKRLWQIGYELTRLKGEKR